MPQSEKLLHLIRASIHNPEFYKGLLSRKISWSFKYFFSFILILAVVSTAVFGWRAVPAVNSFLNNLAPTILEYYPDELEIVIKDGEASSNVAEPYVIKLPAELMSNAPESAPPNEPLDAENDIENALVINTKSSLIDWKEFKEYKALALLSKDAIVFMDKNGGIRIQPLKDFPNATINKKEITTLLERIAPLAKFAAPILVFLIFLAVYAALTFKLVYLVIAALLVWLIGAKFKKIEIGYKKAYQIGIHAMTIAILAEALLRILFGTRVPFLFTLLTLLVVWFNLKPKQEELPTPSTSSNSNPPEAKL